MMEFSISAKQSWEGTFPWGGGHTRETDPMGRGWRLRAESTTLAVIGRPNMRGCISVRIMSNGELDVAMYDESTPNEVSGCLREGKRVEADAFYTAQSTPGWALPFLMEIEQST